MPVGTGATGGRSQSPLRLSGSVECQIVSEVAGVHAVPYRFPDNLLGELKHPLVWTGEPLFSIFTL